MVANLTAGSGPTEFWGVETGGELASKLHSFVRL
jgi:hypothetical protein